MPATSVHRGDIVFVHQRGRLFHAKVLGAALAGQLRVQPLERAAGPARIVAVAEITEHWARTDGSGDGAPVGQISLAELDGWT